MRWERVLFDLNLFREVSVLIEYESFCIKKEQWNVSPGIK